MQSWHLYVPLNARGSSGAQDRASVEDSFSNKEMRAFSRIREHQSTSEIQVCEGQKQSQLLSTTLPLWFWRRIRLVVHIRDKFPSFVMWNVIFQPTSPHFFRYICGPKDPETDIAAFSDSISYFIYRVLR